MSGLSEKTSKLIWKEAGMPWNRWERRTSVWFWSWREVAWLEKYWGKGTISRTWWVIICRDVGQRVALEGAWLGQQGGEWGLSLRWWIQERSSLPQANAQLPKLNVVYWTSGTCVELSENSDCESLAQRVMEATENGSQARSLFSAPRLPHGDSRPEWGAPTPLTDARRGEENWQQHFLWCSDAEKLFPEKTVHPRPHTHAVPRSHVWKKSVRLEDMKDWHVPQSRSIFSLTQHFPQASPGQKWFQNLNVSGWRKTRKLAFPDNVSKSSTGENVHFFLYQIKKNYGSVVGPTFHSWLGMCWGYHLVTNCFKLRKSQ